MIKKFLSLSLALSLVLSSVPFSYAEATALTATPTNKGSLVIVGGALGSTNESVYNKYIALAGGKTNAKIGIIPAASGNLKSSNNFKKDLIGYGVPESQIKILEIAVVDDSKTKDVDESKWIENANKVEMATQIKDLNAIWFVGGDQTRITKAMLKTDGSQTLALKAIWELYQNGGVIGGSSAGAAIMSNPMIAGGNSLGAINSGFTTKYVDENDQLNGPVYLEKGLGFFPYSIVDQHFDARARLGRLTAASWEYKKLSTKAYGVDENTAMIFNEATKLIEVAGAGGVTVINVANAIKDNNLKQLAIKNVSLSFLSPGDQYNIETGKLTISTSKDETNGYEYYDLRGPIVNTGVLSGYNTVKNFIAYNLIDNAGAKEIKSYCFDDKGLGAELIFSKTATTKGWWGYQSGNMDSYSADQVNFEIKPIQVTIKAITPASTTTKPVIKPVAKPVVLPAVKK